MSIAIAYAVIGLIFSIGLTLEHYLIDQSVIGFSYLDCIAFLLLTIFWPLLVHAEIVRLKKLSRSISD